MSSTLVRILEEEATAFMELVKEVENLLFEVWKSNLRDALKDNFPNSRIESVPRGFNFRSENPHNAFQAEHWKELLHRALNPVRGHPYWRPSLKIESVEKEGTYVFLNDQVELVLSGRVGGFAGGTSVFISGSKVFSLSEFSKVLTKEREEKLLVFGFELETEEVLTKTGKKSKAKRKASSGKVSSESFFHPDNLALNWKINCDVNGSPSYLRNFVKAEGKIEVVPTLITTWAVHTMQAYHEEVMAFMGGADRSKFRRTKAYEIE